MAPTVSMCIRIDLRQQLLRTPPDRSLCLFAFFVAVESNDGSDGECLYTIQSPIRTHLSSREMDTLANSQLTDRFGVHGSHARDVQFGPTPIPDSPLYARIANNMVYEEERFITTTIPGRRALQAEATAHEEEGNYHRQLVVPITPENCYEVGNQTKED